MTEDERKTIKILADIIKGEINVMCITEDESEFVAKRELAKQNLDILSKTLYTIRFVTEREDKNDN